MEQPSWTARPSTRKTAAPGPPVALWIRHPRAVQEAPSSCPGHGQITRPGTRVRPPPLKIEKTTPSEAPRLPPWRVQFTPSGVDEPGDMLDQLVRDIEHGRIRNQQSPSAAGVMSEITTPTTGALPRHHPRDQPISPRVSEMSIYLCRRAWRLRRRETLRSKRLPGYDCRLPPDLQSSSCPLPPTKPEFSPRELTSGTQSLSWPTTVKGVRTSALLCPP